MPFLFAALLLYTQWNNGGISERAWGRTMGFTCIASIAIWLFRPRGGFAPQPSGALLAGMGLLVAIVGLQLAPMPIDWIGIISPARAELDLALGGLGMARRWIPLSVSPTATLAHLARLLTYLLVFLLARESGWRLGRRIWHLAIPLVVVAAIEAGIGLNQYSVAPAHGLYPNPNHFAGFLEMSLPFSLTLAMWPNRLGSAKIAQRVGLGLVSALILVAQICSLSRAGFAAMAASTGVLLGIGIFRSRTSDTGTTLKVLAVACTAVVIPVSLLFLAPDRFIDHLGSLTTASGSISDARFSFWNETLHLIGKFPLFGTGLGTYVSAIQRYRDSVPMSLLDYAHNDYLQLAAELGLVGMLPLAFSAFYCLRCSFRAALSKVEGISSQMAAACAASLVAIAVHSLADFNLYIPANAMTVAWVAGLGCALELRASLLEPRKIPVIAVQTES